MLPGITSLCQRLPINELNVRWNLHKGFILRHGTEVEHLARQRPWLLEGDFYYQTRGKKLWHQLHSYPEIGCSINFVFLERSQPVGNMISAVIYMAKPLIKTKRSTLRVRIGLGPGYVFKIFDLYSNYKNVMFGSHFNFCLNGRINYTYRVNRFLEITTGIGIIHFSNGAIKLPNQGINIPSIHAGIGLTGKSSAPLAESPVPEFKKVTMLQIFYGGGVKDEYPTGGPKFWASTLLINLNYRTSYKSGWQAGLDFSYDPSLSRYFDRPDLPFKNKLNIGLLLGYELYFGKLSLLIQAATNVYDVNKIYLPFYQRYGLRYYLCENFFAQLTMKSHFGSVDYVETGIGFNLPHFWKKSD